jgi:predicted transcriptional regulator of viral defense system
MNNVRRFVMKSRRTLPSNPRTPVLRARDFPAHELQRLLNQGGVERAARGVYLSHEAARSPHRELLVVATRVRSGVFCLLTALAFHGLTTEMPHEVWIAIGLKARTPALNTPPLRIVRLAKEPLREGVEIHQEQGVELRVFSAAKSVADCFKFRNSIGVDVAVAALREGWEKNRFTVDELWRYARVCRVEKVMRPYLEAILA